MTQEAKKRLFQRAETILKERCDPYVTPVLSRQDPRGHNGVDQFGRAIPVPVADEELERIVRGDFPAMQYRLFVRGDSGMGKSMFLVYCEQEIARGDRLFLPLRLGAGPKVAAEVPTPLCRIAGVGCKTSGTKTSSRRPDTAALAGKVPSTRA